MKEIQCSKTVNSSREEITGTVTLRIPISTPNDDKWLSSSEVVIGGFKWIAHVRVNTSNQFCPKIKCNQSYLSKLWICKAICKFGTLDNEGTTSNNFTYRHLFRKGSRYAWSSRLKWPALISDNSLVKDGHVTIQVVVTIDNHAGLRKFTPLDFSKPTRHSDVILLVGHDRFHVNKTVLAIQSSYFDSLFFSDFAEKDEEEVKLLDIDPKEFKTFLHFIYQSGYSVTNDNYESLLELADMFQVTSLLETCEDFLSLAPRCTQLESLRLAEKYGLPRVLMSCTETFKDAAAVKAFTKQKEFGDLSLYTQLEIFKKINQF